MICAENHHRITSVPANPSATPNFHAHVQAINALKELFCTVLLPDRKLLFFEQQSLGSLPVGKAGRRHMLYFYMEDAIKKRCAL